MKELKKPLVFAEFGMSKRDPGYTTAERDAYIDVVYGDIFSFARAGGAFGGGLVWQLMAAGMDSYYDGYEIVLSQEPDTSGVLARQSRLMTSLRHTMSRPHSGPQIGAAAAGVDRQEDRSRPPRNVRGRRHGARGHALPGSKMTTP